MGQNKTYIIMAFGEYLDICGALGEICIHFLAENHSTFLPDHSFGVISKCYYNQEKIDCFEDLV
uniref:Uncharacterized protein n=1 Tax=Lepeophtheirus salmonis TaxID=72036 RepID=A0A0K2TB09_LEPSM